MSTFLVKQPFHYSIASSIVDDIQLGRSAYYYYLGKVLPWDQADVPPLTIQNTLSEELSIRNEIVAMEKINGPDVSLVIPRIDWKTGQSYDMWDSSVDMTGKQFYVMTEDYNIYKCIDNNNGAVSTIRPYGTSISMVALPDGYVWKYMYTVPLVKRNRFESVAHIPVQRSMADSYYDAGAIIDVVVNSQGTGYLSDNRVTLTITGGNPTTNAELVAIVSETTGSISSVIIVNPGSGYTGTPTITPVSDTGAGNGLWGPSAVIRAIVSSGQIVRVSIDDPGENYPNGGSTYIDVDGDGVGCRLTPIVRAGKIEAVSIDDRGSGYTYMNAQVVGNGEGATLSVKIGNNDLSTEQSLVESTAIDGAIHVIKINQTGNSYTTASIEIIGDGIGATAVPIIQGGAITGVSVTSPGYGYTNAQIVITGDNLSNNPTALSASAYPIMSPSGGHGKDAPRELLADTVCFYSIVRYSTNTQTNISQDFRQYGVIKNPSKLFTEENLGEPFALTTYTVSLSGLFGVNKDEILHNGDNKYRVIDTFPGNSCILLPLNTKSILVGETLTTENGINTHTIQAIQAIPLANKYSGEMLFASSDYSFAFNTNQSVTIKTYMKL